MVPIAPSQIRGAPCRSLTRKGWLLSTVELGADIDGFPVSYIEASNPRATLQQKSLPRERPGFCQWNGRILPARAGWGTVLCRLPGRSTSQFSRCHSRFLFDYRQCTLSVTPCQDTIRVIEGVEGE